MVRHGSVYQSYTDTGQTSDPSGLIGSRRAKSGQALGHGRSLNSVDLVQEPTQERMAL